MKYMGKIAQIEMVKDIDALGALSLEDLKDQLRYWKEKCKPWGGAFPSMLNKVPLGGKIPKYDGVATTTETKRIHDVLLITLQMEAAGVRLCAGNELDPFLKFAKPPWSRSTTSTIATSTCTQGKDKAWSNMTESEKAASTRLGWTETSWDEGDQDPMVDWDSLTATQRAAAQSLGFSAADFWDV
jgi:hypothetical protein